MSATGRMTVIAAVAVVLTSAVLYPVFTDSVWFADSIGAVIVVAAAGAASRLRPLPIPVCVAANLAGLLLYLNLIFEHRHSWLFVIPTPGSVTALWQLARSGLNYSYIHMPPVPNRPDLLLLAAGGVGIAAVLTDLIAVRLRSTALAGLPLLVLFTVPVMLKAPHSQVTTPLVFCLGGAGYLAMLSADGRERIRVWGRLISLWRSGSRAGANAPSARASGPDTRALAATGRRVGLMSIVLALCAPLLLPGLHPGTLFSSGQGTGGTGRGGTPAIGLPDMLSQTISQLRAPAKEVLSYATTASQQLQRDDPQYLQLLVYDQLTESTGWEISDYKSGATQIGTIPPEPGLGSSSAVQQVRMSMHAASDFTSSGQLPAFLPVPFPTTKLTANGIWVVDSDFMVYSGGGSSANQNYSTTSLAVDPTPTQLSQAPGPARAPAPGVNLSADVQLPSSYQLPVLKKLAESITAKQNTEYAKADALAKWLASHGHYKTTAPGFDDAAGLVTFLTRTRSGVCVQFSWAMTVLDRLLGIPTRIVSGFTAGTLTSRDHYVVTTKDSHAWPEVYFQGYGWIRFEPTPGGQGTANTPNYMTGGKKGTGAFGNPGVLPSSSPSATAKPKTAPHHIGRVTPQSGSTGPITTLPGPGAGTPWAAIALAIIAAIVLAVGIISIVAPPARRAPAWRADGAGRRRRPVAATLLAVAAAALVALALYRLLSRSSKLDLGAGWANVAIAFAAAGAVMLITPALAQVVRRRWRWIHATDDASRAHAAWREFHDDLADFGVGSPASEPPRTLAGRLADGLPEPAGQAIRKLALAEERACYAARPAPSQDLRQDVSAARRGLAARAGRGARWRARIFPVSLITAVADSTARIPDRAAALKLHRRTAHRPAS